VRDLAQDAPFAIGILGSNCLLPVNCNNIINNTTVFDCIFVAIYVNICKYAQHHYFGGITYETTNQIGL